MLNEVSKNVIVPDSNYFARNDHAKSIKVFVEKRLRLMKLNNNCEIIAESETRERATFFTIGFAFTKSTIDLKAK